MEASSPPGYDDSTSRWQTSSSIWTLRRYYPVIPVVTSLLIASFSISISLVTITDFRPCLSYVLLLPHSQAKLLLLRFYADLCKPLLLFKRLSPQPNCLLHAFALLSLTFLMSTSILCFWSFTSFLQIVSSFLLSLLDVSTCSNSKADRVFLSRNGFFIVSSLRLQFHLINP